MRPAQTESGTSAAAARDRAPGSDLVLNALNGFYGRWQAAVVAYLTGDRPRGRDPAPHEFVDRIHSEWRHEFWSLELPATRPSERTFWGALEWIETGGSSAPRGSGSAGELVLRLTEGRGLPDAWFASRPGERAGGSVPSSFFDRRSAGSLTYREATEPER